MKKIFSIKLFNEYMYKLVTLYFVLNSFKTFYRKLNYKLRPFC